MKLQTINSFLHKLGLTLTVVIDKDQELPTDIWLERYSAFLKRCNRKVKFEQAQNHTFQNYGKTLKKLAESDNKNE